MGLGGGPQATQVVLDRTPFYAEGGGQIGDRGELRRAARAGWWSTTRSASATRSSTSAGWRASWRWASRSRPASTRRGAGRRRATTPRTHLLHRALRDVLGEQAKQAGSWVGPEGLRFDFPGVGRHAARAAARGRAPRQRADPPERGGRSPRRDEPRRGAGARRRHVLRREVRPRVTCAWCASPTTARSCAAAPTWRPPGRSARSGSPASRASAPGCGASRRSPAKAPRSWSSRPAGGAA